MEKQPSRKQVELIRKKRMSIANLYLGWVTFISFSLPRISNLLPKPIISENVSTNLIILFWICIFSHSFVGIYLYGLLEWRRSLRVIHMYLGFSIFIFILIDRTLYQSNIDVILRVLEILMWVPVLAHVLLGFRFLMQRTLKRSWDPPLNFYIGGNIVRDSEKK